MMTKRRRSFAFLLTCDPPQRHFVVMQLVILPALLLFLLYGAFDLFRQFSWSAETLHLSASQYQLHLKSLYRELAVRAALIFLIGFLVNVFFGLAFLHRVTGPLVRVRNVLDQIANGQFPGGMVYFRRGDFSKKLAMALNKLIEFLNRKRVFMQSSEDKQSEPKE